MKPGVTSGTIVRLEAGGALSMNVAMQAIMAVGRDVAILGGLGSSQLTVRRPAQGQGTTAGR
ncbi:hypothetical protein [Arthrobacter sp. YN]|uniref:hypothetical protein n=1 Tax=Arthrobacter sp. YN TaxID=2020486 RepID=UPI000B5EAAC4|nr:hypothetical protein [Arthrobacter sp. YN]ASN19030.1 hypothetical protein CGK93_04485 [Arthrobacter sp. YN]